MKMSIEKGRAVCLVASASIVFVLISLSACVTTSPQKSAAEHRESLGSAQERKLTLGVVQSSVREGMSQADVAAALGSPNIVTTDVEGNETWIYDKVATETSYSDSSRSQSSAAGASVGGAVGGIGSGVLGIFGGIVGGAKSAGASDQAGAASRTQRTLTVVIKFDDKRLVKSVRSQMSSF